MSGLRMHLNEAIAVNRSRMPFYSTHSKGRSLMLSWTLIIFEMLSKIPAAYIDYKARVFQKKDIPIIQGDFMPLLGLVSPDTATRFKGVLPKSQKKILNNELRAFRNSSAKLLNKNNFRRVEDICFMALKTIKKYEEDYSCHLAMTQHIIESLGYSALNATDYSKMSQAKTESLSRLVIKLHLHALSMSLWIDSKAQRCHREGVGIIVNDLPYIPFEAKYLSRLSNSLESL